MTAGKYEKGKHSKMISPPDILKQGFWFSDCNWVAYWICVSTVKPTYLYDR